MPYALYASTFFVLGYFLLGVCVCVQVEKVFCNNEGIENVGDICCKISPISNVLYSIISCFFPPCRVTKEIDPLFDPPPAISISKYNPPPRKLTITRRQITPTIVHSTTKVFYNTAATTPKIDFIP